MTTSAEAAVDSGTGSIAGLRADSLRMGVAFAVALTLGQRVIGLVRGILFCRMLPESELGVWSLTWSYLMLLPPLAVLGLPGCFGRYVETYRQSGQLGSYLKRVTAISFLTTVLFSLVLFAFDKTASQWLYRDASQSELIVLIAVSLVLVVAFNFTSSLMEALRQVRLVSLMRVINGVGFAIFALLLIEWWNADSIAVTAGFLFSCLAGTLPAVWYLSRNWNALSRDCAPLSHRSMWSRIGPFAAWLWVSNLLFNLYETVDRAILLYLAPGTVPEVQAIIGQYHSGRIIPQVLTGLAAVLGGTLMAYLAAHWERGDRDAVRRQLSWTVKLVALGFTWFALASMGLAPFLFDHVLHGKYSDGLAIMPVTFIGCIWFSLLTVGQDWLWCRERGKWACAAILAGLAASAAINAILVPTHGLWGAVWGTAMASFLSLIALVVFNARSGWTIDRGAGLAAFFPLILLLPFWQGLAMAMILSWAAFHYGWLFSHQEQQELGSLLGQLRDKWRRSARE